MKKYCSVFAFISGLMACAGARADEAYVGMAKPWQLGFQPPASPVMADLNGLHNQLLVIITVITVLVLIAMVYICVRFSRKNNPVPSNVTHNTRLEIIWTAIPILILLYIAIPSLRAHYFVERVVDPEMTLKVVGYQWYWHYDYPDQGGFGFDSYIKKGKDLAPGDIRQLAVDNAAVVPVNTKVRVQITGADVIHSWAVPAFGLKRDAVPGRLNETWFEADKIGTFYGQCSQRLCGVGHGFMPIVVNVVSKDDFKAWVAKKQAEAGVSNAAAPAEKATAPVTAPVSAEHTSEKPVIDKEKSRSKPTATDSNPAHGKAGDSKHIGNQNQPVPSKAAEDADKPAPDTEQ